MSCVLISGASSGIGAATARRLAAAGADLVLLARREDRLQRLANELSAEFGIKVQTGKVDVRDAQDIDRLSESLDLSKVDVLINNAGLAKGVDKMQHAAVADWDVMIDTNIKGLLYLTRAVLPLMLKQGCGHIVNVGSVAGRWVYSGGAVYCASKFAVRALSEGLRMDLMGTPIRVTNIEPGLVETEFAQVRLEDAVRAQAVYEGLQPLAAEDVAEAIEWTLSRPSHVNVQELVLFPTAQAAVGQVHRAPRK